MDVGRGLTVSAVPERLDMLVETDRRSATRFRADAHHLDELATMVRRGCPGAGLRLIGGSPLQQLAEGLSVGAEMVSSVASAFRHADLRHFVRAAQALVPADLRHRGRTYLRADDRGDGRLVEVLGDLSTAQHVVVLIPGMTNQLSNYETQLRPKAVALYDEARRQAAPGQRVAVIAWLGYNTPDGDSPGIVDAALSGAARTAARQLRSDLQALIANGMRAHVTVVGHSYGSIVVGRAMREGGWPLPGPLPVDDVVVVGSPGMDAASRRALGSPKVRLWAGRNGSGPRPWWARLLPGSLPLGSIGPFAPVIPVVVPVLRRADPVPYAPVHGPDPTVKGFGARELPVSGHGHGDYFQPGTRSLRSIARIAVSETLDPPAPPAPN